MEIHIRGLPDSQGQDERGHSFLSLVFINREKLEAWIQLNINVVERFSGLLFGGPFQKQPNWGFFFPHLRKFSSGLANATMTSGWPKGSVTMAASAAFPQSLAYITASGAGLAVFLFLASLLLVSNPLSCTVQGYFYKLDTPKVILPPVMPQDQLDSYSNVDSGDNKSQPSGFNFTTSLSGVSGSISEGVRYSLPSGSESNVEVPNSNKEPIEDSMNKDGHVQVPAGNKEMKQKNDRLADVKDLGIKNPASVNEEVTKGAKVAEASSVPSGPDPKLKSRGETSDAASQEVNTTTGSDDSGCDLFKGTWFYDPRGPLYTNSSCPVISLMQNCQGNGRPDREYESYRWKPSQCELPRFDAKKFLELMRGKTLAFIGDSVARNQMESLLCLLWQVEVPNERGNKRIHRFYFRSTSTTIVRVWSSWLVHQTPEAIDFAPEGVTKLHLDSPYENFMEFIPTFDVVVLSSGHWFAKRSVYVLNNEIVGGQLWWPDKSREAKINNIEAFGVSVETIVASMATHPNFTGLTILRTYSPDHYEGGAWNSGGSCTGTRPLEPEQLVKNDYTDIMHEKQMTGFHRGIQKKSNKSKFVMMDITEVFSYRYDGHPGPFRTLSPDGKPRTRMQDCLHWCMPGPIDTWNELVLEIIRREYEGKRSSSS